MSRMHPVWKFLITAVVAEITGALTILLVTFEFEAIGFGMVVPAFLIPSGILYLVFESRANMRPCATLAYVIPFVAFLLYCVIGWLQGGEGAGYAYYTAWIYFVSGNVALITLWFLSAKGSSNNSSTPAP